MLRKSIIVSISLVIALLFSSCTGSAAVTSDHASNVSKSSSKANYVTTTELAEVDCGGVTENSPESIIKNDELLSSLNGNDAGENTEPPPASVPDASNTNIIPGENGESGEGGGSENITSETPTPASTPEDENNAELLPEPVEPQDAAIGTSSYTCTLSVICDAILSNMNNLNPEKAELVPEDGVIFPSQTVSFYEGESVFNILQREMKRAKIHMEFVNTPLYNSAYIKAINNIYEFDCGELSGWIYKVNGQFPNYGCSRYQLQPGDIVEIVYSCDSGRDVGGEIRS